VLRHVSVFGDKGVNPNRCIERAMSHMMFLALTSVKFFLAKIAAVCSDRCEILGDVNLFLQLSDPILECARDSFNVEKCSVASVLVHIDWWYNLTQSLNALSSTPSSTHAYHPL